MPPVPVTGASNDHGCAILARANVSRPLTMPRQSTRSKPQGPPQGARHAEDLYSWVQEQVALLRAGRLGEVDAGNIAEELADVGNEQLDKLESAIAVLSLHLLKWDHQPDRRTRSWQLSIREQRRRIARVLKRNPGLKALLAQAVEEGYADGRDRALAETGLEDDALPEVCPYALDDMMTREIELAPSGRKRSAKP